MSSFIMTGDWEESIGKIVKMSQDSAAKPQNVRRMGLLKAGDWVLTFPEHQGDGFWLVSQIQEPYKDEDTGEQDPLWANGFTFCKVYSEITKAQMANGFEYGDLHISRMTVPLSETVAELLIAVLGRDWKVLLSKKSTLDGPPTGEKFWDSEPVLHIPPGHDGDDEVIVSLKPSKEW